MNRELSGAEKLSGLKITMLGGDRRDCILAAELNSLGASVTMVGFDRAVIPPGTACGVSPAEAVREAEVLLLPLTGTDEKGCVRTVWNGEEICLTEDMLKTMQERGIVLVGSARDFLKEWCRNSGLTLVETAELDELAVLNSIPTAEGAIQLAMQETDVTIHGTPCTVIGLGRVGLTLAHDLKGLGAKVSVAARSAAERARAREMGCEVLKIEDLRQAAAAGGMIFNTVPAMVLPRTVLRHARPGLFIADLASKPGGTDFEAAADYGIKAFLAPGLPGKAAPYTAGKILAELIPALILSALDA